LTPGLGALGGWVTPHAKDTAMTIFSISSVHNNLP
jgi:hypothetical protein